MSLDLFVASENDYDKPLAERLRPQSFSDLLVPLKNREQHELLVKLLKKNQLINLILYGPPGTGKTSYAQALSKEVEADFIQMNAVDAGVKDLKSAGEKGYQQKIQFHKKTILFVDEIHRFNKSQQDVLLPFVEKGYLYLIGATTEYPGYELNKALISRCQIIEFQRHNKEHLKELLIKAFKSFDLNYEFVLTHETQEALLEYADGDGRRLLNTLEILIKFYLSKSEQDEFPLSLEKLEKILGKKIISYDKKSDQHYDCISAFIKSMRGSDPQAALYYLARMIEGGEDPLFIARRIVIFASEDVGNADPKALSLAVDVLKSVEAIGMPEGRIPLAQAVSYLSCCPKSNRSYLAINKALDYVKKTGALEVPVHLKSSQKNQGYLYPHDYFKGYVENQKYLPKEALNETFYEPGKLGFEKTLAEYLKWIKES